MRARSDGLNAGCQLCCCCSWCSRSWHKLGPLLFSLLALLPAAVHLPSCPALQQRSAPQRNHADAAGCATHRSCYVRCVCCRVSACLGRAAAVHSGAQHLQGSSTVRAVQGMLDPEQQPRRGALLAEHAGASRCTRTRAGVPAPPANVLFCPPAKLTSPLPVNTSSAEPSSSTRSCTRPSASAAGAANGPPTRRMGSAVAAAAATDASAAAASGSGSASSASCASTASSAGAATAAAAGLLGTSAPAASSSSAAAAAAAPAARPCLRGLAGIAWSPDRGAGTPNVTSSALLSQQ